MEQLQFAGEISRMKYIVLGAILCKKYFLQSDVIDN